MPTLVVAIDARQAQQGATVVVGSITQINNNINNANKSFSTFNNTLERSSTVMNSLQRSVTQLFAGFSAVYAIRDATKVITDFELSMATIKGVTQASAEQLSLMDAVIQRLANTTRFSSREIADGLVQLSKAGFTVEQSLAAIGPTLQLAQAGQIGLADSTKIVSNVLRQFNLDATQTQRVADVLLRTANQSTTDIQPLFEALAYAGPLSATVNKSFEETSAALGVLANRGIEASVAGTNLRGVISSLLEPTTKAQKQLKNMGIAFDEIDPSINSFYKIFSRLAAAGFNAADAVTIFERRQAGAALILTQNTAALKDFEDGLKGAGGEAARMAQLMDDTLFGAVKRLRSALESAYIAIGKGGFGLAIKESVLFLRDIVLYLTDATGGLNNFSPAVIRTAEALKMVAGAAAAFMAIQLAEGIVATARAVQVLTIATASNPLGILAITAAAAVAALIYYRDTIVDIGDQTTTVGDLAVVTFQVITEKIAIGADLTWNLMKAFWSDVKRLFKDSFEQIDEWTGGYWNAFSDGADAVWQFLKKMVNWTIAAVDSVGQLISGAIDRLTGLVDAVLNTDFTSWDSIKELKNSILTDTDITQGFDKNWANLKSNFEHNYLPDAASWGKRTAKMLIDGIEESYPETAEALRKIQDAVANTPVRETVDDIIKRAAERTKQRQEEAAAKAAFVIPKFDVQPFATPGPDPDALRPDLTDAAIKAREQFEKLKQSLIDERALIGLNNDEREKAITLRKAEKLLVEGQLPNQVQELEHLQKYIDLTQKLAKDAERLNNVAEGTGQAFGSFITDAITDFEHLDEVIHNLALSIEKLIIQQLVAAPAAEALTSGLRGILGLATPAASGIFQGPPAPPHAAGAYFYEGRARPFADGAHFGNGLVTEPTYFNMGLMGEKKPGEFIMPAARMPDGSLGVKATGGSGGGPNINVQMHVYGVTDTNSFRATSGMIGADLNRIARMAGG